MKIFEKIFGDNFKKRASESNATDAITAKERQLIIIKSYLKPILKKYGYQIKGQTWWKEQDDFFKIINLQNFSFNTKEEVYFCLNIGIGLKSQMKDVSKKPANLNIQLREGAYLKDSENAHRNNIGYIIKPDTDIDKFGEQFKAGFENEILPTLEKLVSIEDCVRYYEQFPFWGDHLKKLLKAGETNE